MARLARSSLLLLGTLLGAFVGSAGCQSIAGIEERTLDEHAVLCREYCDTVMGNCTEDNAVYLNDAHCMGACLALEPGDSEPTGNTVSCRLQRARAAEREADVECRLAGPGGGGGPCGSDCDAWCALLAKACPDESRRLGEDCAETCATALVDLESFDVERDYGGDTLQCRLVHTVVSLAEDPAVHCAHSGLNPTSMCVPDSDAEPSCDEMCRTTQAACTGANAVYESSEQCLQVCELFELGDASDTAHFSAACRTYHARTAQETDGAEIHCPHAGPSGEGQCGLDADAISTANCHNYCLILESACGDDDGWEWADRDECEVACGSELAGKGAEMSSPGYDVVSAESGDTLHCRVLHAVRALEDEDQCGAAFGGAPCE